MHQQRSFIVSLFATCALATAGCTGYETRATDRTEFVMTEELFFRALGQLRSSGYEPFLDHGAIRIRPPRASEEGHLAEMPLENDLVMSPITAVYHSVTGEAYPAFSPDYRLIDQDIGERMGLSDETSNRLQFVSGNVDREPMWESTRNVRKRILRSLGLAEEGQE